MPSLANLARLALEIFFYIGTVFVGIAGLAGSVPLSVVAALGSSFLSAFGTAWTLGQYGLTFLNFACLVIELGTYYYVSIVYGLLNNVVEQVTRGSIKLAEFARIAIRTICTILIGILLVGWIVGALTWFPEQNAFQQTIDRAVCQTYPVVAPILRLGNVVINFYNSIAEPLNVVGNLLFEFFEDIFLLFLDLVWRGVLLLFRFIVSLIEGTTLDNCDVFIPGSPIPVVCPRLQMMMAPGEPLDPNICIVEEFFCYLIEVVDFFVIEVFERFLRLLFPQLISDTLANIIMALRDSFFVLVDVAASGIALRNPFAGNPFAGCVGAYPLGVTSPASEALMCMQNRTICPGRRLICLIFYWFRIIFGSGTQFINTILGPSLDLILGDRFPTVGGKGIGQLITELLDIIAEVLRVITGFDDLLDTAIRAITDPLGFALDTLDVDFNTFKDLLQTNPLEALRNLPAKLLEVGNFIGNRLKFLFDFITRVEVFAKAIDRALGVLRGIVNSISSGGGLFRHRRLMGAMDPMGIPLNPPEEWMHEIESRIGVYNLSATVVYPLIEIYNNSMRTDCGVEPGVLERLGAKMDWLPSLDNLGKEPLTQGQIDVVRYMITRGVCAEGEEEVGTPIYHMMTLSPRLPSSDICYDILGDDALRHAFENDTSGDWWTEWYAPCAAMYWSSWTVNNTLVKTPMTYMVADDHLRNGLVGLIRLGKLGDKFKYAWNSIPSLSNDEPQAHIFERSRMSFTAEENAAIDADFVNHITRRRPEHPRQKWIDRHHHALFNRKSKPRADPGWGLTWARHNISTHRRAHPLGHTVLKPRALLQTSTTRDFNFTDDVIRPIADGVRRFFSTLLFLLGRLLRGLGLTVYGDLIDDLIEFMRTYETQVALQAILDLLLNTIDTYLNLFTCDYNVVDNPGAPWTIGCLARLQFPPVLPLLPDGVENFVIPYGSPCGNLQTCAFDNPVPNTGTFLDDLFGAANIQVTDGPCRSEYESCSTLGFTDGFDVLIYIIELSSIETGVNVIGFFRSNLFSTLVSTAVNFIGLSLSPFTLIIDDGGFLADLQATPNLRELQYVGPVIFRFENDGIFPRSDFHDFCVGWGYGLILVPGILLLTFLLVLVLFIVRVGPIAFSVVSTSIGFLRPPTYIEQMAREMTYQDALDQDIIVREEVLQR